MCYNFLGKHLNYEYKPCNDVPVILVWKTCDFLKNHVPPHNSPWFPQTFLQEMNKRHYLQISSAQCLGCLINSQTSCATRLIPLPHYSSLVANIPRVSCLSVDRCTLHLWNFDPRISFLVPQPKILIHAVPKCSLTILSRISSRMMTCSMFSRRFLSI